MVSAVPDHPVRSCQWTDSRPRNNTLEAWQAGWRRPLPRSCTTRIPCKCLTVPATRDSHAHGWMQDSPTRCGRNSSCGYRDAAALQAIQARRDRTQSRHGRPGNTTHDPVRDRPRDSPLSPARKVGRPLPAEKGSRRHAPGFAPCLSPVSGLIDAPQQGASGGKTRNGSRVNTNDARTQLSALRTGCQPPGERHRAGRTGGSPLAPSLSA